MRTDRPQRRMMRFEFVLSLFIQKFSVFELLEGNGEMHAKETNKMDRTMATD